MTPDVEIERTLAIVTATLNERDLDGFDSIRVREVLSEALAEGRQLTVDDGGGLHDRTGVRVGAIRRTESGEWITERQNEIAERSNAAIPPQPRSKLRSLMARLNVFGP